MLLKNQHPLNRHITVSVLGVPNAGKSTLINYLLGVDFSIVTPLPQTTRNNFHCIFTVDRTEVVLVDTPGLHPSNREFNKRLNNQAQEGTTGADLALLLLDLSRPLDTQWASLQKCFGTMPQKIWPIFTKQDLIHPTKFVPAQFLAKAKHPLAQGKPFVVSAQEGEGMHLLMSAILAEAQNGPHLYPQGEMSNKNERFFVGEYIREQAFKLLKDELPYEIAVIIDEYRKLKDEGQRVNFYIAASILVNRPSQRGIVVGRNGQIIKSIGVSARPKIEAMVRGKVFLNLHVKVAPKWFKKNAILEKLDLPRAISSSRVWHSSKEAR